jgi:hypothetical protein
VRVTSSRDLAIVIGGPAIVMGWATKKHKVVYVLVIVWHASVIGRHTIVIVWHASVIGRHTIAIVWHASVIGLHTLVIGWHALVIRWHTTFIGWHALVICHMMLLVAISVIMPPS